MEDEFIEDDYLDEDEGSTNNRPFLMAVGALVTVFILAAICTLAFLMASNRSAENSVQVAARETENAVTLATNTAVAQFIAQTETAQAMPTDTPEPPPTNTSTPSPSPTETPEAAETPVLGSVEEGVGEAGGEETAGMEEGEETTDSATGTIVIGEGNEIGTDETSGRENGETGSAIIGGTSTPISGTDTQKGALPQTGLETWGIALIGLLLVAVLFVAHRLRTN